MVDSFLDQRLFVREDYILNNNGPLTAVAIRRDLIKSIEDKYGIKQIVEESKKHYLQFVNFLISIICLRLSIHSIIVRLRTSLQVIFHFIMGYGYM